MIVVFLKVNAIDEAKSQRKFKPNEFEIYKTRKLYKIKDLGYIRLDLGF